MCESQRNILNNIVPTIEYKKCFIAFLDILGFETKVMESQDRTDKLNILIDSLKICGGFPSGGKKATGGSGALRTIDICSRFFSDTIVFYLQADEENIAQLFFLIRYLQDRLWEKEICLRGAITLGDMYWPDKQNNITVGPGLIDAYRLEKDIAIYPRIIVSRKLYAYINKKKAKADPFGGGLRAEKPNAKLKNYIKKDADGVYFLDLLNSEILRTNDERFELLRDDKFSILWNFSSENNHVDILAKVESIIRKNIRHKNKKVWQKYQWLKSYMSRIEKER